MKKSLLFIPDISGFTEFVQTTEVSHSQHIIAELLEVLIEANTINWQLAEVEGDALFCYIEEEVPSFERLLAQVEDTFTAFHSHLKLLEVNRICPCRACASAPDLRLKIIAHVAELEFIEVQGKRKPFGSEIIEAHRLLKNSIDSDNYVLISEALAQEMMMPVSYQSKLYDFQNGSAHYDGKALDYRFSIIDPSNLDSKPFASAKKFTFSSEPNVTLEMDYPVSGPQLFEMITNYANRHLWSVGVDEFQFNNDEVTRVGSEHVCIINGKHFNIVAVTKDANPGEIVYGELTKNTPIADELYTYFIIDPKNSKSSRLRVEIFFQAKSIFKKLLIALFFKKLIKKNVDASLNNLHQYFSKDATPASS
jgi:hypothetical protein